MAEGPRSVDARDLKDRGQFLREVVEPCRPVVLRGLVEEWPLVAAGRVSPRSVCEHLLPWDTGGQIDAFFGAATIAGKYYYTDDLKGFNFERRRMKLREALEAIVTYVECAGCTVRVPGIRSHGRLPAGFCRGERHAVARDLRGSSCVDWS